MKQSYSVFGWHTPGEHSPDEEALLILSFILGAGRYSRLFREVVGEGGANSASASNMVFEDVGMFAVLASFDDGNLAKVESGIIREVERIRRHGVTDHELQLAKNRLEADQIFDLEHVLGQAETLSFWEARGGYEQLGQFLKKLHEVSPAKVREVANRYLEFENLTLYRYRPAGSPAGEPALALTALTAAAREAVTPPEETAAPASALVIEPASADRPIQRFVLTSGATLFVLERRGTPSVSCDLYFRGGRSDEHSRNAGITQLMARSMRRGTSGRSAEDVDREIEFLGTSFGIRVDEDFFGISLDILRQHFAAGLSILGDLILDPAFRPGDVSEERQLQLASIRRSYDSSSERPFQLFRELFYGSHPYGLPGSGYLESVESLSPEALRAWYESTVVSDRMLITVVGDVDAEAVRDLMELQFGEMRKSGTLRYPIPPFVPPATRREVIEVRDRKQSAIVLGFPTVPPAHPDWIVLRLIQDVTSGLAGTFFAELRGKRSLAYTVYAGESSSANAGAFIGYIATESGKEREAREGLLREFRRIATDGVTPEDLERAKSHVAGTTRIRTQTNSALAAEIVENYLYNLGLDFRERFLERIHGITLEELRDVAKTYFSGDNYAIATLRGEGASG